MRPVQYFSDEYLKQCQQMSVKDRVQFLEDFSKLQDRRSPRKSRLISMRIDEVLLDRFKAQAKSYGLPYQTLIKQLMRDYLASL